MPNFSKIFLQGNPAFSRSNQERQQSRLSSILDLQIKDFEIKEFFLIQSKNSLDKDKICEILNAQDLDLIPTFFIGPRVGTISPWSSKTKEMVKVLKENKLEQESILFILDEIDLNLHLSARNIPNVEVATVKEINPVLLLRSDKVVIVPEAFKLIEDWVR